MVKQTNPAVTRDVSFEGAVSTTVNVASADLKIVKSAPTQVDAGGTIDWSLNVSNLGPADSHGFIVKDAVPTNVTNPVLVSAPEGCALVARDLVCSVVPVGYSGETNPTVATIADITANTGTAKTDWIDSILDAGSSFANIQLSGTAPTTWGTVVTNTATVAGVDSDPVVSNNTSTVPTVTRTPEPDWSISKTAAVNGVTPADGTVKPGDVVTYTVTAAASSGQVTEAVLTDDLSMVLNNGTFVPGSAQLTVAGGAPLTLPDPSGTPRNW
ncbi:hypothetical protein G7066_09600 [Leucobacter coleopterorum]|uniref:DUF11 domain-containing protein n=1 Tax=Leucobacter coleopterorum TaxID=2714933 RepID=A0ABX6JWV8_9MICO|nr:DUF11 domain-containing protein [Leucobacter coleopterorum]QIM18789.1 hypothetical protein G7066_09600 [Leucobacter coleopterorum]